MSAVGADGRRYPVRPVREAKYVTCVCGRERSAAFVARIESGA